MTLSTEFVIEAVFQEKVRIFRKNLNKLHCFP
jgi:hypothetical protein